MSVKIRAIMWFRQDLRLHDNEALQDALTHAEEVFPVYVFDERTFKASTAHGIPRMGSHRARFILESVNNLKDNLQRLGGYLHIAVGHPEDLLFELARKWQVSWICCNRERTRDEVIVQERLERRLWTIGVELRFSRGKMLYYTQDLPFPITHMPTSYTQFRKEVERIVPVRQPLAAPDHIPMSIQPETSSALPVHWVRTSCPGNAWHQTSRFPGGESFALARVHHLLRESEGDRTNTKEAFTGVIPSAEVSPWLSQGCLSPKWLYYEWRRFTEEHAGNEETNGLFMKLLWRDYFRLIGKKFGNHIFRHTGIRGKAHQTVSLDKERFNTWAAGRTGFPLVDASMRELNTTGFLTEKSRQWAAGYLVHEMGLDWRLGAEYFECQLIDYDPCSNWGNWMTIAGAGPDHRDDRPVNFLSQARKFDPAGAYVRQWIPALQHVPNQWVHTPDQIPEDELECYGLQKDKGYTAPSFVEDITG